MNGYKLRAKEILSGMSLQEKIGQVTQVNFDAKDIEASCQMVKRICPGSIILCWTELGGNEKQQQVRREALDLLQKTAVEETNSKIPLLFGRDVIHGHHISFPVPLTMTQSFDFELIERSYDAIRQEAVADGVKWAFAPMLDMSHEPRWGRIVEGPGEDPYLGSMFARASIRGFQTDDYTRPDAMLACAKHFVGYGASEGGRDYNHTEISDYNLQNNYLPAFRTAVQEGVATVMSAFNDVNGVPVTGSKKLLTTVLRDQLGFEGFVVSDWAAIQQLYTFGSFCEDAEDAAKTALQAGVDMDMVCNTFYDNIQTLMETQNITADDLDRAVLRIIETKLKFGLFDNPYTYKGTYNRNEHLKLAEQLAAESIVLLKNEDSILPLSGKETLSCCGNFIDEGEEMVGSWSVDYDPSLVTTVRRALLNAAPSLRLTNCDEFSVYKRSAIKNSDYVLVVLGQERSVSGEAASIAHISLSDSQRSILRAAHSSGKKVIGVLCFARPIALGEDKELFDALLWCGHGGTKAADAIADVLFGKVSPQGRLSFTLPHDVGQLPLYYNSLPGSRRINEYYNDVDPEHSNYYDCTGAPDYPFGYGLSYTKFDISDFSCDCSEIKTADLKSGKKLRVSFKVINTGEKEGVCLPQLYIRDLKASRIRPLRSLIRFCRVSLLPLESKALYFDIDLECFGFYSELGEFIVENGEFELYLGENSLAENKITVKLI